MKYCKITTRSHPLSISYPICREDINALLINEGYVGSSNLFSTGEFVINLDMLETTLASIQGNRAKNRSMDFTFGIANIDLTIQLMVLVEVKLNYLNPNNLNRENLEEKVAGSFLALTEIIPIYANYIFIFRTDKKEEAKNRLFRMHPRIPNEYFVMDLYELKATFF